MTNLIGLSILALYVFNSSGGDALQFASIGFLAGLFTSACYFKIYFKERKEP